MYAGSVIVRWTGTNPFPPHTHTHTLTQTHIHSHSHRLRTGIVSLAEMTKAGSGIVGNSHVGLLNVAASEILGTCGGGVVCVLSFWCIVCVICLFVYCYTVLSDTNHTPTAPPHAHTHFVQLSEDLWPRV